MAAKRKSKNDTTKQEQAPPQIDGILVQLVPSEKGRAMNIEALGGVTLTELPTLLRLAAKQTEARLGV